MARMVIVGAGSPDWRSECAGRFGIAAEVFEAAPPWRNGAASTWPERNTGADRHRARDKMPRGHFFPGHLYAEHANR